MMTSRPTPSRSRPLTVTARRWPAALGMIGLAVAGPVAVTAVLLLGRESPFRLPALLYLVVIVLISKVGRMWPAMLAGALSVGALFYWFSEPRGTFSGIEVERTFEIGVFAVIAFILARTLSSERVNRESAEMSHRRLAFVAEANEILARARLDYTETMERLAALVIPEVADWCTVDVLQETGRLETVAFAASAAINPALVESLRHQSQPQPDAQAGVGAVTRTGRPELYPRFTNEVMQAIARDARHLALLRGLKVTSMMKVPLFIRGRPMGALTLASVQRRRRFTEDDLALAEDLAARAGSAIENARLYQERVGAARTLQKSLLPPSIPTVEGLEIAARFHPFGEGDLVGGDFYDVFEMGTGRWAVVVGDVCGKGVEAAALTGLARHTVRASAMAVASPRRILEGLNEAILRQGLDRFATVSIAVFDISSDQVRVTVCNGGHPSPILVRAKGQTEPVGVPGSLLGLFADVDLVDCETALEPGDTLAMYTDGWLDERQPAPEQALADSLKRTSGLPPGRAADLLEQDAPVATQDDRALVMVRVAEDRGDGLPGWRST